LWTLPMKPELAVLIPAWNERENLEHLIPALNEVLGRLGVGSQIIVIDGGSEDGTAERAEAWGVHVLLQKERGYGGALLTGFSSTTASFIVTMDADLSHPPVFIEELWKRREEAEVLIASRYVPGGSAEMSLFRLLLSRILNGAFGWLLSMPIRDLSTGFRLYHRKVLTSLHPVARDFDFLQEVLILVYSQGWRVKETPFHYAPRGAGKSHARLLRFGWGYSKTLWRMRKLRRG
jgi:dolichol-phosphate mannosyltransferase